MRSSTKKYNVYSVDIKIDCLTSFVHNNVNHIIFENVVYMSTACL